MLRYGRKTTSAFAVPPLTPTRSPEYRSERVVMRPSRTALRAARTRTWIGMALLGLAVQCSSIALTAVSAADPAPPSNTDRDVLFHKIKANKVLFLGNSITLHGPAPAIGWLGNWGMAASTQDHDYVHLILKAIAQTAGRDPESVVTNIADFERRFEAYDLDTGLKKELAFKADLVIVAIGENVPALTTEPARAAFQASLTKLLRRLNENSAPVLVVRSCFWPDRAKDTILEQACQEVGGVFVDARALAKDEANFARSERTFSHAGVAGHPGDKGMQAIAEAILQALTKGGK